MHSLHIILITLEDGFNLYCSNQNLMMIKLLTIKPLHNFHVLPVTGNTHDFHLLFMLKTFCINFYTMHLYIICELHRRIKFCLIKILYFLICWCLRNSASLISWLYLAKTIRLTQPHCIRQCKFVSILNYYN